MVYNLVSSPLPPVKVAIPSKERYLAMECPHSESLSQTVRMAPEKNGNRPSLPRHVTPTRCGRTSDATMICCGRSNEENLQRHIAWIVLSNREKRMQPKLRPWFQQSALLSFLGQRGQLCKRSEKTVRCLSCHASSSFRASGSQRPLQIYPEISVHRLPAPLKLYRGGQMSFYQTQQQNHHHSIPNLQVRFFDYRKAKKKKPTAAHNNPFKILKIPEGATLYKDAKKKFLQIAMKNHPDMGSQDLSEQEKEEMRETFIQARMAFEKLAEDPMDGTAILKVDLEDAMENFDSWFRSETGLETPFQFDLDPQTMKEVATMTETIGGGLDRDGGMWALARMVTASVKAGSDAATVLRLESGDVKGNGDRAVGSTSLRRVRKR